MKNFKEMSFADCIRQSCIDLSEELFPAECYACNSILDAYVIRCRDELCGEIKTWFHFYIRDTNGKPVCFRAVDDQKNADKLWKIYINDRW